MFDLIVNGHRNTTRRDLAPLVISWAVHALVIGAVVLLPLLFATNQLPAVPEEIMTYVTVAAPPPPPPPPPPASAPTPAVKRASPRPAPTARPVPQAPVVAPRELPPVIDTADDGEGASDFDSIDGALSGRCSGRRTGRCTRRLVGGIVDVPLPPPPPPPAPRAPVRIGGQIQAPALVKRVPPVYPPIAAQTHRCKGW